jgi:hypothetical protein
VKRATPENLTPSRLIETPDGLEYQADGPDCRVRIAFPDTLWTDPRWVWFRNRVLRSTPVARDDVAS